MLYVWYLIIFEFLKKSTLEGLRWIVIIGNWSSYWLLVVECSLNRVRDPDRENLRWMLRNFILHCSHQGMSPYDSRSAAYKSLYGFSIREVVRMPGSSSALIVRDSLMAFESTMYSSSMFNE